MKTESPSIVTFYSYKGGVGRSMALANVACILAKDYGKKVLVVDWDLEAPGLHRFFGLDPRRLKPGLIDILYDYKALLSKDTGSLPSQLVDIDSYINSSGMPSYGSGGSVALIAAGYQDENYASRVNDFSWDEFYKKWHGFGFIEYLKGELKKKADIVLLDSRTGVTDIGGICTLQLPDVVVLMFALNEQNISGVEAISNSIVSRATEVAKRPEPPALILRPSRVEIYLEETLLKKWQQDAANRLGQYLPRGEADPRRYMAKQAIPYIGAYSFGERPLAVDGNAYGPLTEAYESLSRSIMRATGSAEESADYKIKNLNAYESTLMKGKYLTSKLLPLVMSPPVLILLALTIISSQYLLYRHRKLEQEVQTANARANEYEYRADIAEARLAEAINERDYRRDVYRSTRVVYTANSKNERTVAIALAKLNLEPRFLPPSDPNLPPNVIFFGSEVDPSIVKTIAVALVRADIQIKGIYRFRDDSYSSYGFPRTRLIEVGASKFIVGRRPLTVEDIRNAVEFEVAQ